MRSNYTLYINHYSLVIIVMMTMIGCYADHGNYDYHELDEVRIDTAGTGIQSNYAIQRFDTLELSPEVYFNGQRVMKEGDAPLTYQWTIFSAVTGAGASNVVDTLGHERYLKVPIIRTGGNYLVQLVVTNQNDGIRQFFRVGVSTVRAFPTSLSSSIPGRRTMSRSTAPTQTSTSSPMEPRCRDVPSAASISQWLWEPITM